MQGVARSALGKAYPLDERASDVSSVTAVTSREKHVLPVVRAFATAFSGTTRKLTVTYIDVDEQRTRSEMVSILLSRVSLGLFVAYTGITKIVNIFHELC